MKRTMILSSMLGIFCLGVLSAQADMSVIMGTTGGGSPYTATVSQGSDAILGYAPGTSFNTFCLEKNEYFTPNNTYNVTLSTYANKGGVGGATPPLGDPLDIATAWLYSSFLDGAFTGTYSAAEVQNVVWYLEQEGVHLSAHEIVLRDTATIGGASWINDFHGVQVMNLSGDYTPAQSQIIRAIPTPNPVPVPGAALLGVLGFASIGSIKRRLGL